MKKIKLLLLIAILLSFMTVAAACVVQNSNPSPTEEYTLQHYDPGATASQTDESVKNYFEKQNEASEAIQPQLILKSKNKTVEPMSFIYSSETYIEDLKAFIHATEVPIDIALIVPSLPELSSEDEYHIIIGTNEKLISMSLYSFDENNLNNIKVITANEPLKLFNPNDYPDVLDHNGTIIVQIRIAVTGKYIQEIGQSENYIYSCLYKISRV